MKSVSPGPGGIGDAHRWLAAEPSSFVPERTDDTTATMASLATVAPVALSISETCVRSGKTRWDTLVARRAD